MFFFDTHLHLDALEFRDDYAEVWQQAQQQGVVYAANAGAYPQNWDFILELATRLDNLLPCIGIHPMVVNEVQSTDLDRMRTHLKAGRFVAIGEIGLDPVFKECPLDRQEALFRHQLELGLEFNLPLCLHIRHLHQRVIQILDSYSKQSWHGIAHCFSGSPELAVQFVQRGFLISLAGPLCNPNAKKLHRIAREIPLDRLVVETDSPDLPPRHLNVTRNEPAFVVEVVKALAEIRQQKLEVVAEAVFRNACELFGVMV